jgi:hypothetical protein
MTENVGNAVHVPRFAVTLIHGTYAKRAAWTNPSSSRLCAYLKDQFGNRVHIDAFPWKGSNHHAARRQASEKLISAYQYHAQCRPHFFIGHSHGGSVLAYALRDNPQFAEAVAGIAFLSTPFIQVRKRNTSRWVLLLLPLVLLLVMGTAAIMAWVVLSAEFASSRGLSGEAIAVAGAFASLTVLAAGLLFAPGVHSRLSEKLHASVDAALRDLDLTKLRERRIEQKTLIIRTNGDEASSVLAAGHILARVLLEIPSLVARLPLIARAFLCHLWKREVMPRLERRSVWTRVCVSIVAVLLLLFLAIRLIASYVPDFAPVLLALEEAGWRLLVSIFMTAVWAFIAAACVSAGLALLAIPTIGLLFRGCFGRWQFISALSLEISVEPTPPGEWSICQLDLLEKAVDSGEHGVADRAYSEDFKSSETGILDLAHSSGYNDPRAHRAIADWIRTRLAARDSISALPQQDTAGTSYV